MNILAIDPGKSGGICVFYTLIQAIGSPPDWDIVSVTKHKLLELPLDNGLPDVGKIQDLIIDYDIDVVVLEKQQTRSRQANQAVIMEAYGMLKATATLCGVEVVELRPQEWQATLGLSGDKQANVAYAEAAGFDIPWTSYKKNGEPMARAKKHDGIADAVCIGLAYREMVKHG